MAFGSYCFWSPHVVRGDLTHEIYSGIPPPDT